MRRLLAVLLALPCIAWANHAVPRGGYVNGRYKGGNTIILRAPGHRDQPDRAIVII